MTCEIVDDDAPHGTRAQGNGPDAHPERTGDDEKATQPISTIG